METPQTQSGKSIRVVKLGGSLVDSRLLKDWLDYIAQEQNQHIVIVPGGGAFADQVRSAQQQWHFSDKIAHAMALVAMQQMAMLFQGITPGLSIASTGDEIKQLLQKQQPVIWSPDQAWLDASGIAASWDITSDSLAAWLAKQLPADMLVMVKSAPIAKQYTMQTLFEANIVDAAFGAFIANSEFAIKFFNRQQLPLYKALKDNA